MGTKRVRSILAVIGAFVAGAVVVPVGAYALENQPVVITDGTSGDQAGVLNGMLLVTAPDKQPLPVTGTVGSVPAAASTQVVRQASVQSGDIIGLVGPLGPDAKVAITNLTFANLSSANANVDVFGYEAGDSRCSPSFPLRLGPDLTEVSVLPHDSVVVPLTQPIIAPRRSFADNWCLGASVFRSGSAAEVHVTLTGYRA